MMDLIRKLERKRSLSAEEYLAFIKNQNQTDRLALFDKACQTRNKIYGNTVFLRGLIEISNICRNDCYYCGIRKSNEKAVRYRLSEAQILSCCASGYALGLRTFVLQGGEDGFFSDKMLCSIISAIKNEFPDCAVTLSLGERSLESYQLLREAGADRYLLRHETADEAHYTKLHPKNLNLANRKRCLYDLKKLGYQVGAGFMVGSPGQTDETLAKDLKFLEELQPHMVGIGPFIPHGDTPFAAEKAGEAEKTLFLLALVRLILPRALIPATTALGTVAKDGWQKGILAGANVIMPNLTPEEERGHYALYDGKNPTDPNKLQEIEFQVQQAGCQIAWTRGDYNLQNEES